MSLPRVLVIEDNDADLLLLSEILKKELGAHHFEVLPDGEAALNFVREHRTQMYGPDPCVIVLDLRLPKHDGIKILTEVRRAPALSHITVVVLSSGASRTEQAQIEDLRAFFREKPCDLDGFEALAAFIADLCRGTYEPTGAQLV